MDLTVPGDKSLTHRALLLSALADGESRLSGLLASEDPRSTADCLRALGVDVPPLPGDGAEIRIRGVGLRGLRLPHGAHELDAGNSGTTARLLMGVLAAQDGSEATLTGDASLRRRPMERVTRPLARMGAVFTERGEPGRLPIRVRGGPLHPLDHRSPVASGQVKSALLLAGLASGVRVSVTEPRRSRDHTERLLVSLGVGLEEREVAGGWEVRLTSAPDRLPPLELHVPGDFSSAAFLLALGLLGGAGPELRIRAVGLNPTRTGLLRVLERMGAPLEVVEGGDRPSIEPVGDLVCRPGRLRGVEVPAEEVSDLIDEIPILSVIAARSEGRTRITGAAELRVKESDRIHALAQGLRRVGVSAEELEDGLEVEGTDRPLRGRVESFGDHRIAMAFGVLGRTPGAEIEVEGTEAAEVSFPGFWALLEREGARGR